MIAGIDAAAMAETLHVVVKVYRAAKKQGWLDKLRQLFQNTHTILVVGSSGTGKSQLLSALKNILPDAISGYARTMVAERTELKIKTEFLEFVDTPGHGGPPGHDEDGGQRKERTDAIHRAFKKKRFVGVINVVSYGYHQGEGHAPDDVFEVRSNKVSASFLAKRREREIKALSEWTSKFDDPSTPTWLMTVVTKADLWWSQKSKVLRHYKSGAYFRALASAKEAAHVISFSSVFRKFYGKGPTDGEFDQEDRSQLRDHLLRQLLLSAQRGKGAK